MKTNPEKSKMVIELSEPYPPRRDISQLMRRYHYSQIMILIGRKKLTQVQSWYVRSTQTEGGCEERAYQRLRRRKAWIKGTVSWAYNHAWCLWKGIWVSMQHTIFRFFSCAFIFLFKCLLLQHTFKTMVALHVRVHSACHCKICIQMTATHTFCWVLWPPVACKLRTPHVFKLFLIFLRVAG